MIVDIKGHFRFEVWDGDVLKDVREVDNLVTTEGVNNFLDVMFSSGSATDPWKIGIINAVPVPTLAVTDTYATIGTPWTEFTNYTGTRQSWVVAAPAARSITSSASAVFPILGTASLYGGFITDDAAVLFSEAAFSSPLSVVVSNTVNVVYTLTFA